MLPNQSFAVQNFAYCQCLGEAWVQEMCTWETEKLSPVPINRIGSGGDQGKCQISSFWRNHPNQDTHWLPDFQCSVQTGLFEMSHSLSWWDHAEGRTEIGGTHQHNQFGLLWRDLGSSGTPFQGHSRTQPQWCAVLYHLRK